tara:strand:- start:340 stop:492 length:153 start_codon:yes stop_codon:yes gene_type:complete
MFSEKEIRRVIREELRNIIVRHNLKQLNEQPSKKVQTKPHSPKKRLKRRK